MDGDKVEAIVARLFSTIYQRDDFAKTSPKLIYLVFGIPPNYFNKQQHELVLVENTQIQVLVVENKENGCHNWKSGEKDQKLRGKYL